MKKEKNFLCHFSVLCYYSKWVSIPITKGFKFEAVTWQKANGSYFSNIDKVRTDPGPFLVSQYCVSNDCPMYGKGILLANRMQPPILRYAKGVPELQQPRLFSVQITYLTTSILLLVLRFYILYLPLFVRWRCYSEPLTTSFNCEAWSGNCILRIQMKILHWEFIF